jgi:hypothetical protein
MINMVFQNWNFIRIIRLLLGIGLLIESVKMNDYFLIIISSAFTLMPLLNIGCTGGNCRINSKK